MDDILKEKIDQMSTVYMEINKKFRWEHNLSKFFVAALLVQNDVIYNEEDVRKALKLIKSERNWTLGSRDGLRFLLAGLVQMDVDTLESTVDSIKYNEIILKKNGFVDNIELPLAGYILKRISKSQSMDIVAKKGYEIFNRLKKECPLLPSGESDSLNLLLATSNIDIQLEKMESIYEKLLSQNFKKCQELRRLSQMLTVSGNWTNQIVNECAEIKAYLTANGYRLSPIYYATIGLIYLGHCYDSNFLDECIQAANYLETLKKYRLVYKGLNITLATLIVVGIKGKNKMFSNDEYCENVELIVLSQIAALIDVSHKSTMALR